MTNGELSLLAQGTQYFRESVVELKKVSTPTRPETVQATIVTIMIVTFISAVVSLLDLIFRHVMGAIL